MSLQDLPSELLTDILARHLPHLVKDVRDYSAFRQVSKTFNHIIIYALVELEIGWTCFRQVVHPLASHNESLIVRYWKARLQRPLDTTLPPESKGQSISLGSQFASFVGRGPISTLSAASATAQECEGGYHAGRVRAAMFDAALHYGPRMDLTDCNDLTTVHLQNTDDLSRLSTFDKCLRVFCKACILIHSRILAWQLPMYQREIVCDYRRTQWTFYHPSHHAENWILRAAAYTNDIETVETVLESMRLHITDLAIWRERLSEHYTLFVRKRLDGKMRLARWPIEADHSSMEEQRWVCAIGAAFKIAASLGHTHLITRLIQIEPDFMRHAFTTCFWTSSSKDWIATAIKHDQTEAFQLLSRFSRPMVTSTGFARKAYFFALASAFNKAYHGLDNHPILENLLGMSDAWKYPEIMDRMLHSLAKANNIKLAKTVLDHLARKRPRMFAYHSLKQDVLLLFPGSQPRNFVIATAAYYGHIEFVRFLLSYPSALEESKNEALECAIHTLTCHVKSISGNHIVILEELLASQKGLFLEDAFLKAVHSHSITLQFMNTLIPHINLSAKSSLLFSEIQPRGCRTLQDMKTAWIMDPKDRSTVGEIALAVALKNQRLEIARTLVESHGVVLEKYFVHSVIEIEEVDLHELAELNETIISMGMEVKSVPMGNDHNFLEFVFLPKSRPSVEPIEFNFGAPIYCKI